MRPGARQSGATKIAQIVRFTAAKGGSPTGRGGDVRQKNLANAFSLLSP